MVLFFFESKASLNKIETVQVIKSDEFVEIDFDKIDESSGNNNVVYERCLEEISKLKAKIKNLETKLNRCQFKRSNSRLSNDTCNCLLTLVLM